MNNTISSTSPKNTYRAEITWKKALDFGSVESYGAMSLEALEQRVKDCIEQRRSGHSLNWKNEAHIVIRQNRAEYPKFDWAIVKEYDIK